MSGKLDFETPSWEQLYCLCLELGDRIRVSGFKPDLLIGIIRGGLVPLRILADEFGDIEVTTMRVRFYEDMNKTSREPKITQIPITPISGKSILIVDDVADTGCSLDVARNFLRQNNAKDSKVAVIYYKPWSKLKPDFYVKTTQKWIIFPHERKETIISLSRKMSDEGLNRKEIRQKLIDIGIEPYLVDRCFLDNC